MQKFDLRVQSIGPVGSTPARGQEDLTGPKILGVERFMLETPKPALPKK